MQTKEENRLWREQHPGSNAEHCKRWKLAHPEQASAAKRKYVAANREKIRAQMSVHKAVKSGRLKRLPCRICNDPNSHAHHQDYSKRLDVTWLCNLHHKMMHRKTNKNLNNRKKNRQ